MTKPRVEDCVRRLKILTFKILSNPADLRSEQNHVFGDKSIPQAEGQHSSLPCSSIIHYLAMPWWENITIWNNRWGQDVLPHCIMAFPILSPSNDENTTQDYSRVLSSCPRFAQTSDNAI